jgi:hypothetical protein
MVKEHGRGAWLISTVGEDGWGGWLRRIVEEHG